MVAESTEILGPIDQTGWAIAWAAVTSFNLSSGVDADIFLILENGSVMRVNDNYNGYDLSYLVVRYLIETNSQRDFYFIMKDKDLIKSIGNNVLESAMKYYKNKYFNTLNIK